MVHITKVCVVIYTLFSKHIRYSGSKKKDFRIEPIYLETTVKIKTMLFTEKIGNVLDA